VDFTAQTNWSKFVIVNTVIISVADDFSRYPAGRSRTHGPNSGERFREELLWPNLSNPLNSVTVKLDGTRGYNSSFLDEAFAGLLREHPMLSNDLEQRLVLIGKDASIVEEIWGYIREQKARGKNR
jgi:STAS-like domain of unknown function (DUF4325)